MTDMERFPNEKRRSPRVRGAVVEYSIDEKGSFVKKAFIKDICIHGICIYMPEIADTNKTISMSIFLFGSDIPITAKGRVVWNKAGEYMGYYNVGLEFTEMPEEDRKRLSDHIKETLEKEE